MLFGLGADGRCTVAVLMRSMRAAGLAGSPLQTPQHPILQDTWNFGVMSPDVCVRTFARTPQDNNTKVDLQEPPHEWLVTSSGDAYNEFVVQARRSIL